MHKTGAFYYFYDNITTICTPISGVLKFGFKSSFIKNLAFQNPANLIFGQKCSWIIGFGRIFAVL